MEENKYYLGLDMGTSSVGWAVTDAQYRILRKKGKDMWGVREFEQAESAAERRSHRIARRRRQRQVARIGLLKDYFADEIEKVDKNFYVRLENSKYFMEDKDERLQSHNGIFDDDTFRDEDYYKRYPTIFHLRAALLDMNNTGQTFDVRLVYLALLNMFKHRGHFLLNTESSESGAAQIEVQYEDLIRQMNENYGVELAAVPVKSVIAIIGDKEIGRKLKHEKLLELFSITRKNKRASEFLKCMSGLSSDVNTILEPEAEEKIAVCFHDFSYVDKIPELMDQLGEEKYTIIEQMKAIYDYAILTGTLQGYEYLSLARVADYEKHRADLKCLKEIYRKYKSKEAYDRMFRSDQPGTYSAYVNSLNSDDSVAADHKYRRNMKDRKAENLYDTIKKELKDCAEGDEQVQYVLDQMEKEQFLPKQLTGANGVIPNQVHRKEMARILKNAESYLPFLKEQDASGYTVSERILKIFSFQIPYYVGPLGAGSKTGWVQRKAAGRILPWNLEEKIDKQATAEEFIKRLIRSCTYLAGEKVMPKASLAYEKYCVLNEINNLRIDGERIDTALKQRIFNECFMSGKRVTRKQLCKHLEMWGKIESEDQVSGIDITINQSLSSYGKLYAIFGDKLKEDKYRDIAEDIIYWGTVFTDSKKMYREHLNRYVESGDLTEADVKRILGYKFKDWGRFSRALLELQGCDKSTGEKVSLLQAMWDNSLNFMELINSPDFTFREALEEKRVHLEKTLTDFEYEDLDGYYFSAPVKRMIWQTILVVREIEKVMGQAPARVFVEMTRSDEEKGDRGRKSSRASQLLAAYKNIKNTQIHDWKKEISEAEGNGKLRSKKLYLYYMQMGRDMYTGKEIDLARLFDDNLYDIDHIYPRHYVKDDSIINNLVLVNKEANEHLKKDLYPIPAQIASNPEVRGLWDALHKNKLITDEKYHRLMSREQFTDKQMGDFIARQLVETSQGTKGVAELLKALLSDTTEIIYAKASNVSEFRHKNGFVKSRLVNEFHHAQDAYLNIVVGNVYYTKFTKNPWNFIKDDYEKDKQKYHYNMDRMFDWDVVRGSDVAWIADKKDRRGTIYTVREMLQKNTPLMTRMVVRKEDALFNVQPVSHYTAKVKNYVPVKKGMMGDVSRYGGYSSLTPAYFIFIEVQKGKKRIKMFESVPLYYASQIQTQKDLEKYCIDILGYCGVRIILQKIEKYTLFKLNGYFLYIVGLDSRKNVEFKNATSLVMGREDLRYIKNIESRVKRNTEIEDSKSITKEKNQVLYETLVKKHNQGIFRMHPKAIGNILEQGGEKFSCMAVTQQVELLLNLISFTSTSLQSNIFSLNAIAGPKEVGRIRISGNMSDAKELFLINRSVLGVYESRVNLLKI